MRLAITVATVFAGAALVAVSHAQDKDVVDNAPEPPPLPPKVQAPGPGLEPTVTITTDEKGQIIEEYRNAGGVLYMVKVTPKGAPAYFLYDPDGDGTFVADEDSNPDIAPVQWKVAEWK